MTTTNTNTPSVSALETVAPTEGTAPAPYWWVDDDHADGFGFEPDHDLGNAVAALLQTDAAHFDAMLARARDMAAADAASKLSRPRRAEMAAAVWVEARGRAWSMSASTYSKRCKAGRATDDQVLAFLEVCDTPSIDKLYEWLPKEATGRPRGSKSKARDTAPTAPTAAVEAVVVPEPVSSPETAPEPTQAPVSKPVEPYRWDSDHVSTGARAAIDAWRAQGADDVTIRLLAAEALRLVSPVRSVA